MFNMVLAALLGASISGVGTYMMTQRAPPDTMAIEQLDAKLDQLVMLERGTQEIQAAAWKAQLEGADHQIMLGRLIVRALTGSDPLPILKRAQSEK